MPNPSNPSARPPWPLSWALAGILALLALLQGYGIARQHYLVQKAMLDRGRSSALHLAQAVDARLRGMEPVVRALAADLAAGRLDPDRLPERLRQDLARTPEASRIGVAFAAGTPGGKTRLMAPFAVREENGIRSVRLEESGDYTRQMWFLEAMDQDGWGEPHPVGSSHDPMAGFSVRFRLPGSAGEGVARVDLAMENLRQLFAEAGLTDAGYGAMVSAKGVFMVHPRRDWVEELRTTFQVSQALQDPVRWRAGEWALRGERGEGVGTSYAGTQPVWLFAEPVPASRWSVEGVQFKEETPGNRVENRRALARLACILLALTACLALARVEMHNLTFQRMWRYQMLVSTLLTLGTGILWGLTLAFPNPPNEAVTPVLGQEKLGLLMSGKERPRWPVPTGILVETLRLGNRDDILASGRVWQRYPPDYPKDGPRGFFFPDAEEAEIQEVFHRPDGADELREFTFKATVRQEFENAYKYPFDEAVIHLRVLPQDFLGQVALVPDFRAYAVLTPAALPGLGKRLEVTGWKLESSYFGLVDGMYGTTFGAAKAGEERAPELSYQVVLARKFIDPFISAMLPVIVVACLLFTLLLVFDSPPEGEAVSELQAGTDVLGGTATLLFPVIYAQISLREKVFSNGLIYLEYIYFIMYAVILLVAVHALTCSSRRDLRIAGYPEFILAKLAYWPGLLGAFFLVSFMFLY